MVEESSVKQACISNMILKITVMCCVLSLERWVN